MNKQAIERPLLVFCSLAILFCGAALNRSLGKSGGNEAAEKDEKDEKSEKK